MKEKLAYLFENWKTVPNLLSFIRILLIPVFAVLFYKGHVVWAAVVLAISGLSDMFDGKIARRFNQVSNLGKMLDPIADKLTIATIAVVLFLKFHQAQDSSIRAFSWVFLLFIVKDIVMLLFGAFMISRGIHPGAAEIYGKVATAVFYVVMVFIMAFGPEVGAFRSVFTIPNAVMMVLVVIAVILTIIAFLSYIPGVWEQMAKKYNWKKKTIWGQKERF